MKFRKKPVVIDAVQWDGTYTHAKQLEKELGLNTLGMTSNPVNNTCSYWKIATLEDGHVVSPLDWIITGVKGEHYPCKPDIFAMTYEATTQQPADQREVMQQAVDALEYHCEQTRPIQRTTDAIAALRQALAAPQAQSVAGVPESAILDRKKYHHWPADGDTPEDYELFDSDVECDDCIDVLIVRADMVAAAQAREPLDHKSIWKIYCDAKDQKQEGWLFFARAIEAAHGIAQANTKEGLR